MDLVKYPEYKDSGAEVIDDIPKSWETHNMKFLIESIESGKRKDVIDKKYAFSIGGEHINWNGSLNLKNERYVSKDFYNNLNKGKIKLNDVLLVKDGATIGKTAFISDKPFEKMAVNEHVFIIRSNDMILPKLLYYLVRSNLGFMQIKLTENGSAQGGINSSFPSDVYFPVCDELSTQYKIANYLDNKIAKIDKTIEINQKLIELLEEKRVALINQVVTKGLNPDVEMKYSGIEWFGKIPEHWDIGLLKYLAELLNNNQEFANKSDKYIGLENIESKSGRLLGYSTNGTDGSVNKFQKENILFGKLRPYLSKVIIAPFDGVCSTEILVYSPNDNILTKFLFYYMLSNRFIEIVNSTTYGVKMPRASQDIINNMSILIPPLTEQKQIVNYLDNKIANLNRTKEKIEEQINLLEEYKESLIYNVVTGKVDVRGEDI